MQNTQKIKITADAIIAVGAQIFSRTEVNTLITDPEAPKNWRNKFMYDILNVEHFAFKHRPASSDAIIAKLKQRGENVNELLALDRAFCSVYITGTERQFQGDVDVVGVDANLEYWIQTPKIKLLETLIENANVWANGLRFNVNIGSQERQAVIIFDEPSIVDIQASSGYGEMAIVEVGVSIMFYPQVTSYSDYTITFTYLGGTEQRTATIPLSMFNFASDFNARPVPWVDNPSSAASLNLSRVSTAVVQFEGWDSAFIDWLATKSLNINSGDINEELSITINRKGVAFLHNMVIQHHAIRVAADITNEEHTLNLTTRGVD